MKIAMIGTGYVGLVTGACFADFGFHVTCVDQNTTKIDNLNKGISPIFEPGLEELLKRTKESNCLFFTTDIKEAVYNADVVFIAVGTPTSADGNGSADLSQVLGASKEIALALNPTHHTVIVTKSTVPVGTSKMIDEVIKTYRPDVSYETASNPEFLREGSAIEDFMNPDRVVVGVRTEQGKEILKNLYRPLENFPILCTQVETAELIKYASNAFLATKIAFINEMANLCEKVGADVQEVAKGMGLDSRIGGKFLNPGPGYGGSCFPKDTRALAQVGKDLETPLSIIDAVIQSNDTRRHVMFEKVKQALGGNLTGKKVAILGLTFKSNTDDLRDSISLDLIPALQAEGASIRVFDPIVKAHHTDCFPNVTWAHNAYEALEGCEGGIILTEWNEFKALDFARVKEVMQDPLIIDLRNLYHPIEVKNYDITYHSIGRLPVYAHSASDAHNYGEKLKVVYSVA